MAGFNLAHNHGTQLVVFFRDGKHEGSIDVSVHNLHVVKVLQKRRATARCQWHEYVNAQKNHLLPPRSNLFVDSVLHILANLGRNGNKSDVSLGVETNCLEERSNFSGDLIVSSLVPLHSRVIHLVDNDDELVDTIVLDEHRVLSGLTLTLETGLKLALSRGQHLVDSLVLRFH